MYRLTNHARRRIRKRKINPMAVLAALDGRRLATITKRGTVLYYDRTSRVCVVVDPRTNSILSAYRLTKATMKRNFSR